jgi:hypothetical protein
MSKILILKNSKNACIPLIITLVFVLFSIVASAQPEGMGEPPEGMNKPQEGMGGRGGHRKKVSSAERVKFVELQNSINSYVANNILPDFKKSKDMLNSSMTKADKAILDSLKAAEAKMEEQRHQKMMELAKNKKDTNARKEFNEMNVEMRKNKNSLNKQVIAIANKYPKVLENIQSTIESKSKKWNEDISGIVDDWQKANSSSLSEKQDNRVEKMKNYINDFVSGHKQQFLLKFMMWDGSDNFLNNNHPEPEMMNQNDK